MTDDVLRAVIRAAVQETDEMFSNFGELDYDLAAAHITAAVLAVVPAVVEPGEKP